MRLLEARYEKLVGVVCRGLLDRSFCPFDRASNHIGAVQGGSANTNITLANFRARSRTVC